MSPRELKAKPALSKNHDGPEDSISENEIPQHRSRYKTPVEEPDQLRIPKQVSTLPGFPASELSQSERSTGERVYGRPTISDSSYTVRGNVFSDIAVREGYSGVMRRHDYGSVVLSNNNLAHLGDVWPSVSSRFLAVSEKEKILSWLKTRLPLGKDLELPTVLLERSSAQWLLDSQDFKSWRDGSSALLWLEGFGKCSKPALSIH